MTPLNEQMLMLIRSALIIYLAALVLFWLLTRTATPAPALSLPLVVRMVQPVLFLCGLFTLFVIGGLILLILIIHLPDNFVTATYPLINREAIPAFVNQFPEGDFMLPLILVTLAGIGGLVWLGIWARKRLFHKAFDEHGDLISRILRRIILLIQLYGIPVFCFVGIILGLRYDTRLARNIETLPEVFKGYAAALPLLAIFTLGAIGFGIWILRQFFYGVSTYRWSATEGSITTSRVTRRYTSRRQPIHFHDLRYIYRVGVSSKEHTGKVPHAGFESSYESYAAAWYRRRRYPEGATVPVYFNPNKPEQSVLVRGIDWFSIISKTLQLIAISLFGFLYLFYVKPM